MTTAQQCTAAWPLDSRVGAFDLLAAPLVFAVPHHLSDVNNWHHHIPFAFFLMQLMQPKVFVELGTHKGDSYCAFCQAAKEQSPPTACYAVDTWAGDKHADFYGPEVLQRLKTYHDPQYGHFSRLVQSTFDAALSHFADGSIDLLHIDGLHEYEAVRHDFETWLPKMSRHGVVLMHDIDVRENGFGVWRLWDELAPRYPSQRFKFAHGLGILGVGSQLAPAASILLNLDPGQWSDLERLFFALGNRCYLLGERARLSNLSERQDLELRDSRQLTEDLRRSSQAALDEARAELQRMRDQLERMRAERDHARQQIASIYSSTSWRVTRPLRVVAPLVRAQSAGHRQH